MAHAVNPVGPAEAKELLDSGLKYLDVRTPGEFANGHPPGAVNVPIMLPAEQGMAPNPDFESGVVNEFPDKEDALVVGCAAGKRSAMAAQKLSTLGYTIYDQTTGFAGWSQSGLPVAK